VWVCGVCVGGVCVCVEVSNDFAAPLLGGNWKQYFLVTVVTLGEPKWFHVRGDSVCIIAVIKTWKIWKEFERDQDSHYNLYKLLSSFWTLKAPSHSCESSDSSETSPLTFHVTCQYTFELDASETLLVVYTIFSRQLKYIKTTWKKRSMYVVFPSIFYWVLLHSEVPRFRPLLFS
jgi:hypothetical protein